MPSEFPGLEAKVRMLVDNDVEPLAQKWRKELPGDVGFALFLLQLGEGDVGIAYVSSLERDGIVRAMAEWLRVEGKQRFPYIAEFFDFLYYATRRPGDKDYDAEFAMKVRREGFRK